jgi:hypothetical protein
MLLKNSPGGAGGALVDVGVWAGAVVGSVFSVVVASPFSIAFYSKKYSIYSK